MLPGVDVVLARQPALTTGLPLFFLLIWGLDFKYDLVHALGLVPDSLFPPSLDALNRLSFFQVVHINFLHLVLNTIALLPLLREFELEHGTVRTGIILNVSSVLPGIVYCLVMKLASFGQTGIAGSSGWFFTFLAYFSWRQYLTAPTLQLPRVPVGIPAWSPPLFVLALVTIVLPQSSFMGHLVGLGFGYLLGMGYLGFAYEGTTHVVRWIENHIQPVIKGLSHIVVWVTEDELRPQQALPLTNMPGPGQVLGTVDG